MTKPISTLLVKVGADVSELDIGARRAVASMEGMASKAVQVGKKLAVLGAAAAAAGAAFAAKLTREGLEFVDAQAKMARSLDATIDGLRGLQIAAQDSGVDNITGAVQQLNSRLGEAARRGGPAAEALDKLGLSAQQLMALDVDQRMALIADRVKTLGLSAAETADLLRQMGIRNQQMVDFLRQGGDAIRDARKEVDDFGLSISEVDAAKIEAANDAMQRIGRVMEGIRNQLAITFAPMLQEIANRFNGIAKANQGFGQQAARAAELGIRGMARFLDVLRGLHVVFKGVQLVVTGFAATVASVFELAARAVALFVDGVLVAVNAAIGALNKLPTVDIATIDPISDSAFMRGIHAMGESARNAVGEVRSELHDLAMQEMPSAKAEQFLQDVRDRAREAAEAVVGSRDNSGAYSGVFDEASGGSSAIEDDRAAREAERLAREEQIYRESLANRLLSLQEYLMSDEERATAAHERRLDELQKALEAELIAEQDALVMREELEQKHMEHLAGIRQRGLSDIERFTQQSYRAQAKTIAAEMSNITASVSSESRKMFQINKIAGIANAIVSAYEGISLTMSKYPYPLSVAMGAAQAAAAFAQVNAIKSASFGGSGGVAPSLAGGTPAPATSPVGGTQGESRNIFIQGISPDSLVSGRQIAALLEEFVGDGGRVVFGT